MSCLPSCLCITIRVSADGWEGIVKRRACPRSRSSLGTKLGCDHRPLGPAPPCSCFLHEATGALGSLNPQRPVWEDGYRQTPCFWVVSHSLILLIPQQGHSHQQPSSSAHCVPLLCPRSLARQAPGCLPPRTGKSSISLQKQRRAGSIYRSTCFLVLSHVGLDQLARVQSLWTIRARRQLQPWLRHWQPPLRSNMTLQAPPFQILNVGFPIASPLTTDQSAKIAVPEAGFKSSQSCGLGQVGQTEPQCPCL